ncbi:MAG: hypothetical protein RMK31_05770 [Candidatus Caldarchaeum sp.]|nr:hypothetical protein [Candidatus Caldarchaeum sp.]
MPKHAETLSLTVTLLIACCLTPQPVSSLNQLQQSEDYRVLPIDGELFVNVFFYDVDLRWFEARDLRHLLDLLVETNLIRPVAKSQLYSIGREQEFVPFEFEVKLRLIIPSTRVQQEFRELLRSAQSRTPFQIAQQAIEHATAYNMPLAWVDQTIRARDALAVFSLLTEKYYPEVAGKHAIFFFCGIPAMGGNRPAVYYTFGQSSDSGRYLTDFGIKIFGGPWWGRYYYVDLCSYPPPRFYREFKPIFEFGTATERIYHIASIIDLIIDMEFVKSLVYKPRYNIQTFLDVIVIDATVAGVGYDMMVRYFDPEMLAKAMRTLMPYNFFSVRLREVDFRTVPELSQAIVYDPGGILLMPDKAYDILKKRGFIDESIRQSLDYIPAIILYTTTTSWVASPGTLGIAIPRSDNPALPLVATGATYHEVVITEGLTPTVIHEVGHTLGLRHPHDDFDERQGRSVSSMAMTYFTETIMSYSKSWVGALQREQIFDDLYPLRTFWSIFDLDALDRAVVAIMLQEYEANYEEILSQLSSNGLKSDDVPEIMQLLDLARQFAWKAVEEFRDHNYFDRVEFKGLGAQLVSALDYAFAASLLTGNIKNYYLPAVIYESNRLGAQAANLRQSLSSLQEEIERSRRALEDSQRTLQQKRAERDALEREGDSLSADVRRAEQRVAEVRRIREDISRRESELKQLGDSIQRSESELSSLRGQTTLLSGVLAVEAVAVAAAVMWLRRMSKRRLPPPPPPPPPPPSTYLS